MEKTAPFYCLKQLVYHTNTGCAVGSAIDEKELRSGTGHKVECLHCQRLNKPKSLKRKTKVLQTKE